MATIHARFCTALAALSSVFMFASNVLGRALDAFKDLVGTFVIAFVKLVSSLPTLFAVSDGSSLTPAIAGYASPPDSFLRHESLVSHRSAARGI